MANTMQKAITVNSLLLAAFALFVAAGLAGTELSTRDAREASLRKVQSAALEEVVPASARDNVLLDDFFPVSEKQLLKLKTEKNIHVARLNGEVTTFIFPVTAPDGYGGAINSLVGIRTDGTISGVRVISHKETPGLGDKVEAKKSDWVLSFNDRSLSNPNPEQWGVKKDKGIFDQFTGATITPRAVISSIYSALMYFETNKARLFEKAAQSKANLELGNTPETPKVLGGNELTPNTATNTDKPEAATDTSEATASNPAGAIQ